MRSMAMMWVLVGVVALAAGGCRKKAVDPNTVDCRKAVKDRGACALCCNDQFEVQGARFVKGEGCACGKRMTCEGGDVSESACRSCCASLVDGGRPPLFSYEENRCACLQVTNTPKPGVRFKP